MEALADVNVLLALSDPQHFSHEKAKNWFLELPPGSKLCICRVAQLGFLRLVTSNTVMQGKALTMREAWSFYGELIQHPNIDQIIEPESAQLEFMRCSLRFKRATKRVTDSYLAGFAIAGDIHLVTLDKGFKAWDQLKLILL